MGGGLCGMSTDDKPIEFWIDDHKTLVDEVNINIIKKFTWHVRQDKQTFYAFSNMKIGNKNHHISMHRLLTGFSSSEIDHINGNGLDNRECNLRFATRKQNSYNRRRKNSLGFRGVYKPKRSPYYAVQIQIEGKRLSRYGFKTAEEAARAYDKLNKELHGEFGVRNFKD
jgi:hypothetical protein